MLTVKNNLVRTVLLSVLLSSVGYSGGKWKVVIVHEGNDILGKQLVHKLKEELAKSSHFLLVEQEEAVMAVRVLSRDIEDVAAQSAMCSVAFTVQLPNRADASFCDHTVLRVVKPGVDETVTELMATILRICENCVGSALTIPE
jgi:hypothetical protein